MFVTHDNLATVKLLNKFIYVGTNANVNSWLLTADVRRVLNLFVTLTPKMPEAEPRNTFERVMHGIFNAVQAPGIWFRGW